MQCYVWVKSEANLRCFRWENTSKDGSYRLLCEFFHGKYKTIGLIPEEVDHQFVVKVQRVDKDHIYSKPASQLPLH
jgi:hypothetical protein